MEYTPKSDGRTADYLIIGFFAVAVCAFAVSSSGIPFRGLVQIAGLVARRILCYRQIGDSLARGERYGFIRFGSRVDVYIPRSWDVKVTIGEKVTGVSTVIAREVP